MMLLRNFVVLCCFLFSGALLADTLSSSPADAENLSINNNQSARVDINTASAQELAEKLVGVGQKKAAAIIAYRQQHGAFVSYQQLEDVKGIGPTILAKNKDSIVVGKLNEAKSMAAN